MQNPIYILSWVTGLSALWFIWTVGIRGLLLDLLRERLFELRFALFRLGMSGELPFDSDVYRTLEILLCGLLRFGHRITFLTYVLSRIEQERSKKGRDYIDVSQQIALKISRLEPKTQAKLAEILGGVQSVIFRYMACASLPMLLIAVLLTAAKFLGLWRPDEARKELSGVIEREAYRVESRRPLHPALA